MARNPDELARRRALVLAYEPAEGEPDQARPDADPDAPADVVADDASTPDVLDLRATERDDAARGRDEAASRRDGRSRDALDAERATVDRLLAARDRVAAALDREEAALDRQRAAQYLRRTYRDGLTGALQREAGRDQIGHEVARTHRTQDQLVIAFLDVVGLKRVNDDRGHLAGDRVLKDVGAALVAGLRAYDVVVRYGGDEFVCALPNSSLSDAVPRLGAVQETLAKAGIGVSLGFAQLIADESLDDVIARADQDLYDKRGRSVVAPLR
jgi:diguanylate cyclase (GGDEF)-like protein